MIQKKEIVHKTGEAKRETKLGGKDRKAERNKRRGEEEMQWE